MRRVIAAGRAHGALRTIRIHSELQDRAMHRVFVYGTLKSGGPLNAHLTGEWSGRSGATLLDANAAVDGFTLHTNGIFPAMQPAEWAHVTGELWEVDDVLLQVLDKVEGVPYLYTREIVEMRDGTHAFAYVWAGAHPLQPHGSTWEVC